MENPPFEENDRKPLCTMAIFCEKVLNENNVFSYIRVVDNIKIEIPKWRKTADVVMPIKFQVAVSLIANLARGPRKITLDLKSPSGQIAARAEYSVFFRWSTSRV